ncbi:sodium:calcium antiporter [Putridiphycobacter roseus]|uniref:Sodium:calcium antiporter n=1 Tax=Putridiphycobacter roseus TaxID=2219161 RepID=A0A2W1MY01_9FLAO|nr:calcium/sodium antiporter [Putridiphycobacter roseus]PZE16060.1 sodium:calcium antiporter [Putridiphycobacter roseus]
MSYLILILGLITLIIGGEFLVKGAVGIAKKAHISSLVIGMTVISFGTSAPELIVSLNAALSGNPEIAIANVVGSNIANIALVLGITVLIFPIIVDRNSKIIDWPMMMGASILFYLFAYDLVIETWEGIILFGILVVFTVLLITNSRKTTKKEKAALTTPIEDEIPVMNTYLAFFYVLLGLVGLFFGAKWLVSGAIDIAQNLGMSQTVIGVTVVAFGTSVPELVTSAVAAFRKETDISIGNLIGSNLFNIMAVIGLTAIVKPIPVESVVLNNDMIWMLCIAAALLPLMLIGKKLGRIKGVMLFGTYVAYITIILIHVK